MLHDPYARDTARFLEHNSYDPNLVSEKLRRSNSWQ